MAQPDLAGELVTPGPVCVQGRPHVVLVPARRVGADQPVAVDAGMLAGQRCLQRIQRARRETITRDAPHDTTPRSSRSWAASAAATQARTVASSRPRASR